MNKLLRTSLMTILILAMVTQGRHSEGFWSRFKAFFRGSGKEQRALSEKVFNLINDYRVSKSLVKLEWSSRAYKTASNHATLMAKHRKDTKYNAEKKLKELGGKAKISVLERKTSTTNSDDVAKEIFNAWKDKSADVMNILDDKAKFGAVAIRYVKSVKTYYSALVVSVNN